jgi:hypothetical protein
MLINGYWSLCDDGVVRPVFSGEVRAADGSWRQVEFLADTGADRTVLTALVLQALGLSHEGTTTSLGGLGGVTGSVVVSTSVQLFRENGTPILFHGQWAAVTSPHALDMSVLGRDITNLFAVLVDRPGDVVCLIGHRHFYTIGTR